MPGWATSKIKNISGRYGSFCAEIGRLLGEPEKTQSKKISFGENVRELLSSASQLVQSAVVLHSRGNESNIEGYFLGGENQELDISTPYPRLVPHFLDESDLKPCALESARLFEELKLEKPVEGQVDVIHYWLQPEVGVSFVVICDGDQNERQNSLMQIRAEIQRRFYD